MCKSWLLLGSELSFIYISDLLQGLLSDVKLFADHFNYEKGSASALNRDLLKLQD